MFVLLLQDFSVCNTDPTPQNRKSIIDNSHSHQFHGLEGSANICQKTVKAQCYRFAGGRLQLARHALQVWESSWHTVVVCINPRIIDSEINIVMLSHATMILDSLVLSSMKFPIVFLLPYNLDSHKVLQHVGAGGWQWAVKGSRSVPLLSDYRARNIASKPWKS